MKTKAERIIAIYESRTEEDFAHMERRLKELPPDQPLPEGALLAATLLQLRAMENAERELA